MWTFRNFKRDEFVCPCGCGFDDIDPLIVTTLQRLRDEVQRPVVVNSGCRCKAHNAAVKGARGQGRRECGNDGVFMFNAGHVFRYLVMTSVISSKSRLASSGKKGRAGRMVRCPRPVAPPSWWIAAYLVP